MARDEVSQLYSDRAAVYSPSINTFDDLVGVYLGDLPAEFADFFHEEIHVHLINMIRLSWDDLASMAGKVFPIYVDPENKTPTAKQRAEHLEQIAYGYNEAGRIVGAIDMSMLMKILAWWMAGVGEAVAMTLPDYEKHSPFFTFRDPRHYLPPVGWSPFTQAAPDDALFAYTITVGELQRRYPDRADEIRRRLSKSISTTSMMTSAQSTPVHIGEYYHRDAWIVQSLTDDAIILERSDTGDKGHPDMVPVVPMSLYSPGIRARSIFADQVSVQAAMARMFSQKLDFYDRSLYPVIFTSPLAEKSVKVGPWAINEFDPTFQGQFKVESIGPTNAIDADQTMAFVMGLQRMLNRNPESFQGQAPGGRADSAKAINSLRDSVMNTTIREMIWPPMLQALPKLYSKAAELDLHLWPNERKRMSGRRKNQNFSTFYRPQVDLKDHTEDFLIEPGVGVAGYQGTLEMIQLVGAELMPEDEAIEQGEWSRDAAETKRGIQAMRLEKVLWADLAARAEAPPGTPGKLQPGALSKLKKMVEGENKDLFDAIEQLDQKGEFSEVPPPAPEMPGMGAPGGPPGMPPGMPIPPLELLRGGQG